MWRIYCFLESDITEPSDCEDCGETLRDSGMCVWHEKIESFKKELKEATQGRASSQGQPDIIKKLREWLRENYNSEMFGWEVLEFFEPDFPKEGKPNKKPSQGQGTERDYTNEEAKIEAKRFGTMTSVEYRSADVEPYRIISYEFLQDGKGGKIKSMKPIGKGHSFREAFANSEKGVQK